MTKASPFFSDWRFQCVQCLATKEVVQADRETLELLKPGMDAGHGNLPKEWNMLPVSYRASSVFYAQTDSFILFRDAEVTTLLTAARRSELVSRLMKLYNFPGTPLTHDEVMRQLKENGRNDEANNYKDLLEILKVISVPAMKETMERQLSEKRAAYEADGLIAKQHLQSQALASTGRSQPGMGKAVQSDTARRGAFLLPLRSHRQTGYGPEPPRDIRSQSRSLRHRCRRRQRTQIIYSNC